MRRSRHVHVATVDCRGLPPARSTMPLKRLISGGATELATAREEIRNAREQLTANSVASATVADQLAALRRETAVVKAQSLTALLTATAQLDARISELTEHDASATARANEAETKLRAAAS